MDSTFQSKSSQDGLTVKVIRADGAVLLAFDLDQSLVPGFAGFAVQCTPPAGAGQPSYLMNRLSFSTPVTSQTAAGQEPFTPSNQAPFQMYRWAYFPPEIVDGLYTYTVTAMYFNSDGTLKPGPSTSVSTTMTAIQNGPLQIGFTRGFLSSQAYATKFQNAPFEPSSKTIDYDTTSYLPQYQWLGAHARQMMFGFLQECLSDPTVTVDLFAFDLDEPDIIRQLEQLGGRLHAILDDAPLHTDPGAMEPLAKQKLIASAGADHIHIGHFSRFSHSKVLIMKRNGTPVKVLAGSANFSIRGLYVQANNVFIFDSTEMATNYEQAFKTAFDGMSGFSREPVSSQWYDLPGDGFSPYSVCFSPHQNPNLSLDKVSSTIQNAQSSVLFAVMELSGGGGVMQDLLSLPSRTGIFSYGITQTVAGVNLYKPGSANAVLTSFAALDEKVPPPFDKESRGGLGQVIHHKFVVVDFNGTNPVVFAGSSNLSSGGEGDNGDNLVAMYDPLVVQAYAVEAVRLVDHYHFRAVQNQATSDNPLALQGPVASGQEWWQPYYDPTNIKCLERSLFVQ